VREPVRRWQVIGLAVALDLLLGEPPARWHPVVWMGRLVARLERRAPRGGAAPQLAYGAAAEAICLAAAVGPAWLLERRARTAGGLGTVALAAALKPALALRALFEHAGWVEPALRAGDLERARVAVGQIVSRDVGELDGPRVAAAAIESLAENASDSAVAPLLYYSLFGLPGAYLYRMANTLDAMWGYRGRYEYLGKAAARVDDLLNLLPARATAAATVATCWAAGGSAAGALACTLRDASRTASPNAGWPMAAMAGALGVRLEKVGHYRLNPEGRLPGAVDLRRAMWVAGAGLAVAVGVIMLVAKLANHEGTKTRRTTEDPSVSSFLRAFVIEQSRTWP
jgi:adenosylcobinamide-phosphate synthase